MKSTTRNKCCRYFSAINENLQENSELITGKNAQKMTKVCHYFFSKPSSVLQEITSLLKENGIAINASNCMKMRLF